MERRKAEAMAENLSQGAYRANSWDVPSVGAVTEHATIGASIVIKGDVTGKEHLFIEGTVEGSIHFPDHRVTIGRSSTVKADIQAREVVVMGTVQGDMHCGDLLDIRADSHIQGQLVTRRVRIDDGAFLKGSVEIQRAEKETREVPKAAAVPSKPEFAVEPAPAGSVPSAMASAATAEPAKAESSNIQKLAETLAQSRRIGRFVEASALNRATQASVGRTESPSQDGLFCATGKTTTSLSAFFSAPQTSGKANTKAARP
jgi:cytoskeletal protein CcmA (bactofilin family)